MDSPRRVVVTGIGAVTPVGHTAAGLWQGVRCARSAVRRITCFDPSPFRSQIAAQIDDFDPAEYLHDPKRVRRLDRYSQFALVATMQAVDDACLDLCNEPGDEIGIYLGSALGGINYAEEQHTIFLQHGARQVSPMLALAVFGGAASCNVAMELGISGPNIANANSCASGAIAIGEAFRLIKAGGAQVMFAGGVEAPLAPLAFGSFALIKAMSTRNDDPPTASRPFDRERDGFVMGEGAAVLVLEDLEHALRRNARIYMEIIGYGTTNDAYHMTAPRPDGSQAARAMRLALREAGLQPGEIEYINAHASSTPLNDKTETLAIKQVFGEYACRVPVSGTKGMHGHALGASGAIEAAICALSFEHDYLPGNVNLFIPDPECDLSYIPPEGDPASVNTILSNSFGFGGINAGLVFARCTE